MKLDNSYENYKKEQEFKKTINTIVGYLEKQKQELISLINSDSFIEKFFEEYINLRNESEQVSNSLVQMKENQKFFEEWIKTGETIRNELKKLENVK